MSDESFQAKSESEHMTDKSASGVLTHRSSLIAQHSKKVSPLKLILGAAWLLLFCTALVIWWRSGVSLTDVPDLLHDWLSEFGLIKAAMVYVIFYTLRPLVLFPASILTIASGLIFGPWLGTLFTVIGENASANFAFQLARWFGRDAVANHEQELVRRWEEKLCRNGVMAVIIMRLIYLPFDAVNFSCGLTAMRQRDYAIGTFIGIFPGLITFVLLGGAGASGVQNRVTILAISGLFFVLGLAIARGLRRHDSARNETRDH
jgi:uncharacterized membrane protein YdjX (TVP38/TMEM64 family)